MLVVGLGLIGREVARQLALKGTMDVYCPTTYSKTERWLDASVLVSGLEDFLGAELSRVGQCLDIIWCAGRAGLSASEEAMADEQRFFVSAIKGLLSISPEATTVNLVSSAGGVIADANRNTPYGRAKLSQEQYLQESSTSPWRIFRVSSVYGVPEPGVRHGLLATMLRNAALGLPTTVYADASTRRDFILVDDVARHIVNRVDANFPSTTDVVASARSIGLQNVCSLLEKSLNKKIKVNYMTQLYNDSDIVIPRSTLPPDLQLTSLEEGLRLLVARSKAGLSAVRNF